MVVFPNAKVNIGLSVLRKRPDNYHDIETVMVGVDWCDVLEVVPSSEGRDTLSVSGIKIDCAPEKNLVLKAVKILRENGFPVPPVEIYLQKNIPDGAGLGGGSSDASFMLKALDKLFNFELNESELERYAAEIGSDCSFFIKNRPSLSSGRGEILTAFPEIATTLKDYSVVVVKPRTESVSTVRAYAGATLKPESKIGKLIAEISLESWKDNIFNTFEESIFALLSEPKAIKERLYELGAVYAAMSGSGSAVYGIFEPSKLDIIDMKKEFADSFVHIGKFIL